ncbi:MAG: host-nuclease inhibitor Gam family protein [Nitrospiraceae bacterium]|nr:host-nuclease inhibitor Gam family protein [Nitrospiraceae bacterium]
MRKRGQTGFKTWGDVDEALRQISIIELELTGIETRMNAKITEIKERARLASGPLEEKKTSLEAAMKEFAGRRRADFGGKKHIALAFGVVSFRLSTRLVIPDEKRTVECLKNLGLKNCIRVTEAPDRGKMAALDEETLSKAGAGRVKEDVFGYGIDFGRAGRDCRCGGGLKDKGKEIAA